MTRTVPWRRITLHFSHILFTEGRTFMRRSCFSWLLVPVGDATPAEVVGRELHLDPVAGEDPDVVHPHLPGDVRQHFVAVLELHPEHGVREWLDDRPLHEDRIVFGLRQGEPPTLPRFRRRERPAGRSSQTVEYKPKSGQTAKPSPLVFSGDREDLGAV